MPQALPLVAQPDLPSQVNAVEQDGYVYLPRVLDRDQVAELREHMERLEPLAESFDSGPDPKRGFLNRAINNAFNRDPTSCSSWTTPASSRSPRRCSGQTATSSP